MTRTGNLQSFLIEWLLKLRKSKLRVSKLTSRPAFLALRYLMMDSPVPTRSEIKQCTAEVALAIKTTGVQKRLTLELHEQLEDKAYSLRCRVQEELVSYNFPSRPILLLAHSFEGAVCSLQQRQTTRWSHFSRSQRASRRKRIQYQCLAPRKRTKALRPWFPHCRLRIQSKRRTEFAGVTAKTVMIPQRAAMPPF